MQHETVVELRVLRTISRYWIAKINIRTAEASIISAATSSLSLFFTAVFCFFAFYLFIRRNAKWFDVWFVWDEASVCRMSTQQEQCFDRVFLYTFKFISIRFFRSTYKQCGVVVWLCVQRIRYKIEARFVVTTNMKRTTAKSIYTESIKYW